MGKSFEYDEIGNWSEIKLDIVKKYAAAYTKILSNQPNIKKCIYIDAFAGAGTHKSETTGDFVLGSPLNALNITPPFNEFHLIDLNGEKTAELRRQVGSRKEVIIYDGDANQVLIDKVFPRCRYSDYARALCLLDPYSLNVDWNVLKTAGQMNSIEIFYNFMIMDANMNVLWRDPSKVATKQAERMDKVWGDGSWREAAYAKQFALFGDSGYAKTGNETVVEAFRQRLQKIAGFKFVPRPIPMYNKNGATIYYLFFASPNDKGAKIVEYIFDKYRTKGAV